MRHVDAVYTWPKMTCCKLGSCSTASSGQAAHEWFEALASKDVCYCKIRQQLVQITQQLCKCKGLTEVPARNCHVLLDSARQAVKQVNGA